MEQKIKINNKEFTLVLPDLQETIGINPLYMWLKMINEQSQIKENKDEWFKFDCIKDYQFKNLKIVNEDRFDTDDTTEITYNFKCDEWKQDL